MPKGKSSLFAKIEGKLKTAVKKHAGDETNYGRIQIPAGIQSGVAKLTKCYFDKYKSGPNVGELYFRCEGVVVKPTTLGDMKVAGLTTSIMLPVCETKNGKGEVTPIEENVSKVLNEMRKLGADTRDLEEADDYGAALEALSETLQEAGPHFRFSTSKRDGRVDPKTKQKGEDGVWENWNGNKGLEDFDPDAETEDDVQEEAEEEKADVEEKEEETPKPKKKVKAAEPEEEEEDDDETDPLDALATSADDEDDKAAQKELVKIAKQNGLTVKEIEDDSNSWTHLVEMIRAKTAKDEPEEAEDTEEAAEPYVPAKEDIVMHKGPKDKKPMEYEVTAVYKKTGKCDLLNNDDRKTVLKSVPFDKVSES